MIANYMIILSILRLREVNCLPKVTQHEGRTKTNYLFVCACHIPSSPRVLLYVFFHLTSTELPQCVLMLILQMRKLEVQRGETSAQGLRKFSKQDSEPYGGV